MQYQIKNISGIETIFVPMNEANSITIQIFVKAGSIYETPKNNGISHFLEHMFFKGGTKYKTPMEVASVVDEFGGTFNAYTSDEQASYYIKCAPDFIDKAIDVLGDMMVNAQFNKEELEREKGVIIQEVMMKQDNPSSLIFDKWKNYFYGDNSYGRSTLGTIENIKSFGQKDFFEHKNNLYTKDNLIIVIAGKIKNQSQIEELLSDNFQKLPAQKVIEKPNFDFKYPSSKKDFFDKKTEQNHMIISATGFVGDDDNRFEANILATILGGNMSSRLFQNIREKEGLCYYIGGSHYTGTHDGVFFFRAGIEKGRFDYAIEKIFHEINSISNGDIEEKEFQKAIGYRIGQIQMGIESSDEMSEFVGEQYLLYSRIENLQNILDKYKSMKLQDVQKICNKIKKEKLYLYWLQ